MHERIAIEGVNSLIQMIGDNPDREGVAKTPERVLKSMREICDGYAMDPKEILSVEFDLSDADSDITGCGGIIALRDIEMHSLCEHHMLPFVGKAHVAYVPGNAGKVVGLSKLARVVDCFSHRLQTQERIGAQIANAIVSNLKPSGVAVLIEAEHYCMRMRGVKKQNSVMVTSELRGIFRDSPQARAEVLSMLRR